MDNSPIHVLAYDLERTGSTGTSRVIGIGASVVDENFKELKTYLGACFKPNEALFEWSCVEEFYFGTELRELDALRKGAASPVVSFTPRNMLDELKKKTPSSARTQDDAERLALDGFVEFVRTAEQAALDAGATFIICSDCTVSDTHWINKLLEKYRPDLHPLPFSFLTDQWAPHFDVGQVQKGFLTQLNPNWITQGKRSTETIEKYWKVPAKLKQHTHMPDSDAYTIAFDMQAVIACSNKRIPMKDI